MKRIFAALAAAFLSTAANAADLSTKATVRVGYPVGCGYYFGVGTGGSAGAVQGNVAPGTKIVQGNLDALVGYTCPFAGNGFWFVEAQGGISNLNGGTNGLSLNGPAVFIERVGVGSPLNAVFNPFGSSLSMPSLPVLPAGVTQSPGNAYGFVGLVQADMGLTTGAMSGHQWVLAGMVGIGMLTRWSNNVVVDTWAGYQPRSTSTCLSGVGALCAKLGDMVRVGVAFKY